MANYNKVILIGRLTRDPQLSYLPSQMAVIEFGIASSRTFKKQDGSQGEEVCFVDCQMFGKRAEVINKYLHKGDPIFVEGRLKFDSWQDKDGQKKSKLRVYVENFEFIGNKSGSSQGQGGNNYNQPFSSNDEQNYEAAGGMGDPGDDIPF